ncbi:hypothetical protein ACFFWC_03035 [Plantactinospora siamensis]|uniref:Uncharacterized protein n=1 Tax=Plantactinospora siamensis TaxID=555372 RepID=A0ABV6NQE8_9ACTN
MFGIGRRTRHRDLVKSELGESLDHFVQAASHAADGVGSTVGPRVTAARTRVAPGAAKVRGGAAKVRGDAQRRWGSTMSALAPLAVAAADGARQAGTGTTRGKAKVTGMKGKKKKSSGRFGKAAKVLAVSAAVGAAGAMVLRRRRDDQEWNAYDPTATLTPAAKDPAARTESDLATNAATAPETNITPEQTTASTTTGRAATSGDKPGSATSSVTENAHQAAGK